MVDFLELYRWYGYPVYTQIYVLHKFKGYEIQSVLILNIKFLYGYFPQISGEIFKNWLN